MQTEVYNHIIEKSKDKLRNDSSFVRRNYVVLWVAWIIYIAATIASIFSIFAHLNMRASETFKPGFAVVAAGFLTLLVVGCQFMLKFFVDDWQAKAHIKGGSEFAMMCFKGVLGLIGIVGGIWLSLGGASKAVDMVRKENAISDVPLISVDSISHYYDAQRAEYQRRQTAYLNTTWKGNITAPALRESGKINNILAGIEQDRVKAIESATAKNDAMMAEYNAETLTNARGAKGFMGFAEFLIVVCVIIIGLFDDGVKKEAKALGVNVGNPF